LIGTDRPPRFRPWPPSTRRRSATTSALAWSFSIHVHDQAWLAQRREIRSFFVAELDRDKIVLSGPA